MSTRLQAQLGIVAVYLRINAGVLGVAALALLVLPHRWTTGPSLAVLYQLTGRPALGIAMAVLAGYLWWAAARQPHYGLAVLMVAQTFWALAQLVPALTGGPTNLLAPLGWAGLAMTTAMQLDLRRRR